MDRTHDLLTRSRTLYRLSYRLRCAAVRLKAAAVYRHDLIKLRSLGAATKKKKKKKKNRNKASLIEGSSRKYRLGWTLNISEGRLSLNLPYSAERKGNTPEIALSLL